MKHQYRKIVLVTLSSILLLGLSILTLDFDQFGAIPSGQDLTRMRESENYNFQKNMFITGAGGKPSIWLPPEGLVEDTTHDQISKHERHRKKA